MDDLRDILQSPLGGSADLIARAVDWLAENPETLSEDRRGSTLEILKTARHAMSAFTFLADRLAEGLDKAQPMDVLEGIKVDLEQAESRVAEHFAQTIQEQAPVKVITLSYSATVLAALRAAQDAVEHVLVLESKPGGEGVQFAHALGESIGRVAVLSDSAIALGIGSSDIAVMGADTLYVDGSVLNKVLSRKLAVEMSAANKPVYVLATPWKCASFSPDDHVLPDEDAALFEVVPRELITETISE